jgi:hypothetical protein
MNLTIIGLSLMTFAQVASAATWCVNPSGTSGCKNTISAAVSAASPGDTIYVARGDYKLCDRSAGRFAQDDGFEVGRRQSV